MRWLKAIDEARGIDEVLAVLDEFLDTRSDIYWTGVPEGMRSVAWRLTLRHPERTLKEKEISGRRDKVLKSLDGELGVRQRTS